MKLILGDCIEKLKELEENSVDAIVTDPPAGISFMGKEWDKDKGGRDNWIKWMSDVAKECLRVLKPGGHAFVWALPRTSHWTATAWENAGFEIRDVVAHIFGSGFPKSLNVGLAVAKLKNEKLKEVGDNPNHRKSDALYKLGFQGGKGNGKIKQAQNEFSGWGTALKPAREDWILMRKPLAEKSVAENVLKWKTGGINIDESRVESNAKKWSEPKGGIWNESVDNGATLEDNPLGRFPANLIHDNSEEVRECFPETKSVKSQTTNERYLSGNDNTKKSGDRKLMYGKISPENTHNDSGNASRFFKSIKKDFEYSQKYAILKLCENNISVNNAENNLKTTSQIELVANIFSALKSVTPNLDLLNQNLNALFVEKSVKNTSIDFVAKCVAIKEIPEELVNQQDYIVFRDFMEDYKKCSQTQNPVSVEKWGNIDITQIMISLLKLCGYVHLVIEENINSENQEGQKCDYKSLVYIPKASKSERNKGCDGLESKQLYYDDRRGGSFDVFVKRDEDGKPLNETRKNNHPTVKPIALMEYLIKMITPKGGTVLDPFMGSGTTGIACKKNGFDFIGIEKQCDYFEIAMARINNAKLQQKLI